MRRIVLRRSHKDDIRGERLSQLLDRLTADGCIDILCEDLEEFCLKMGLDNNYTFHHHNFFEDKMQSLIRVIFK